MTRDERVRDLMAAFDKTTLVITGQAGRQEDDRELSNELGTAYQTNGKRWTFRILAPYAIE